MTGVLEIYKDITEKYSDPRTSEWLLVFSPGSLLLMLGAYVYLSVSAGPRYMSDKKPLELRNLLIFYNLIQVLASMYLVYEGLMSGWWGEYNFTCQGIDRSSSPTALRMAGAVYAYYVCKLVELLDTAFFVLRKKNQQISFLHVYHHAIMPVCAWIGVRYFPGGHATLLGLINSFIHIFMYAYYMLSSMGPQMHKYLWWKKYLTLMQIAQFCIIFLHTAQLLFNGCTKFPTPLTLLLITNALLFIYLFSSFYIRTYLRPEQRTKKPRMNGGKHSTLAAYANDDLAKKAE